MLDKKQSDLINQEVDRTNSEKERTTLRKLLEKNADARRLFQELKDLTSVLKEVRPVDPPSSLKQYIVNSLPRTVSQTRPSRSRSMLDTLFSNTRYRYVYAFAGGAVAGILLFALFIGFPGNGTDVSDVYGTMASKEPLTGFEFEVARPIDLTDTRGSITAKYSPFLVISEITLDSKSEVNVVLTFDRSKLRFDGFRQTNTSQGYVEIQESALRWVNKGQNTYNIIFVNESGKTPPITVKLVAGDRIVYETTIVPTTKN